MGAKTAVVAGVVGAAAAGLVARELVKKKQESDGDGRHPEGWKAVTVLGDQAAFSRDGYPAPLERLREVLEVRLATAPGDKGFEVHARLRPDVDPKPVVGDDDPDQALRVALRDAKQLFETGEILRATPRPHGKRKATLFGAAVDKAEDEAKGARVCCEGSVLDRSERARGRESGRPVHPEHSGHHRACHAVHDVRFRSSPARRLRADDAGGDVLGHEFLGEVVETGSAVTKHKVGDRVVVCSFISCGRCWYCQHELYSLCDNGNPNAGIPEMLWGQAPGGCYGYSHALGGWAGSHAEYIRVPYADQGAFSVPEGSATSGPCSPPTRRRPDGWAPTSAA
ncbi:alcohol dehydrogenase catalytic domain-containing protein [Leifsonia poae]|uniref:alcohol dehydrogenase catalytic domain-containing protein n=1 Tax=Leifsonia poae TaxID=110933 RepID=UPI003D69CEFA